MKIDLRFTLDSENEEHKKAINVYNSLRRKHRVEFFVELTKAYWDKDLVDYPNLKKEVRSLSSNVNESHPVSPVSKVVSVRESQTLEEPHNEPKKRNPLLG